MRCSSAETVTVTEVAAPAPALPTGDSKMYNAGKAAIAKAKTMAELQDVTNRAEKRRADLSAEQYEDLLRLAVERETELMPQEDSDPFGDD